jgi:hypothetical protein
MEAITKQCSKCKEVKGLGEFGKSTTGKYGVRAYCKTCAYEMRRKWISKNKDKEKEYNQKYRPNTIEKIKTKQLTKQQSNKCVKCNKPLVGRILSTKYCNTCKNEERKIWRSKDYDKNKSSYKKYYLDNKSALIENGSKRDAIKRKDLHNRYIKKLFVEKHGLKTNQITNDLIEVKRLIIKTKRLCKTLSN